jgi:hypothetical protein
MPQVSILNSGKGTAAATTVVDPKQSFAAEKSVIWNRMDQPTDAPRAEALSDLTHATEHCYATDI